MKKILIFLLAISYCILMCSCIDYREIPKYSSGTSSAVISSESKNEGLTGTENSESSKKSSEQSEESKNIVNSTENKKEESNEKNSKKTTISDEHSGEFSDNQSNENINEKNEGDKSSSIVSVGNMNALEKAKNYLSFSAFSYKGLIEQLEFEGFSTEEATYGADNCGADWNEQAVKKAEKYLSFSSFSRSGLIEQLEYEGFTSEQANYAVNTTYDSSSSTTSSENAVYGQNTGESNALEKAKSYLSFSAFSRKGLIEQLEFDGFSNSEATYGADNCGADWNEQAAKKAKNYLSFSAFSRSELIEQLEFEGFTPEQAAYGAAQNGY